MRGRIRRIGSTSKALFYAVVVHLVVGVILVLNLEWPTHVVSSDSREAPVQASVVSEAEIQKQKEAIEQKEQAEKQKQLEAQQKLEELLQQKKEEEQRLARIKEQQEQEKKEAEELARKKEQEKEELAKVKREQELQEQKEKEKKEEERKKAEAERKRKEEAERKQREEEERKRKAAEEQRQKELAEKQQREQELQEQLERERIQRRVQSALSQYIPIIKQKVSRNWNRPAGLRNDIEAHVNVRLSQAGEVLSARIVKSSGNPVFDRSVENAVLKASPLPIPQERGVNEEFRNLKLIFKPEEMIS